MTWWLSQGRRDEYRGFCTTRIFNGRVSTLPDAAKRLIRPGSMIIQQISDLLENRRAYRSQGPLARRHFLLSRTDLCAYAVGFARFASFSAVLISKYIVLVTDQQKYRLLHSSAAQSYDLPPLTDRHRWAHLNRQTMRLAIINRKQRGYNARRHLSSNDQSRATRRFYRWQRKSTNSLCSGPWSDQVNNNPQ